MSVEGYLFGLVGLLQFGPSQGQGSFLDDSGTFPLLWFGMEQAVVFGDSCDVSRH